MPRVGSVAVAVPSLVHFGKPQNNLAYLLQAGSIFVSILGPFDNNGRSFSDHKIGSPTDSFGLKGASMTVF